MRIRSLKATDFRLWCMIGFDGDENEQRKETDSATDGVILIVMT
jgi:hypothetical protein